MLNYANKNKISAIVDVKPKTKRPSVQFANFLKWEGEIEYQEPLEASGEKSVEPAQSRNRLCSTKESHLDGDTGIYFQI